MISKTVAVIVAAVALGAGFAAGALSAIYFSAQFMNHGSMVGNAADASMTVQALEHVRANADPQAIELLEIKLDGAVIGIWGFQQNIPESKRDPLALNALRAAKEYRNKFPRRSGSIEVDEVVAEAFAAVGTTSP